MAQITLVYRISVGNQKPSDFQVRVESVPLTYELEILFMNKISDVTVVAAPGLIRTVVLETTAEADNQYPTDALKKDVTRNLWTNNLQQQIPAAVTADEPVVA